VTRLCQAARQQKGRRCVHHRRPWLRRGTSTATRVVAVAPQLGAFGATLIELPLMLAASWVTCRWTMRRFEVPERLAARLVVGGLAFALLIGAEILLGITAFSRTWPEQMQAFITPEGLTGLAAQVAFALMPAIRRRQA
jgi:hypothetical protein